MADCVFTMAAHGTPGPQGSKSRGRFGGLRESSPLVAPWREAVKFAAQDPRSSDRDPEAVFPLDEPLWIVVVFTLRKPTSAPKRRRTWPDRSPDIDKLLRSTFDALTDAGIIKDDGRIVEVRAAKCFPGEHADALESPGCVIRLYRMEEA